MLSEKEIKRLKMSTKKWIPRFMLAMSLFGFIACLCYLNHIRKLVDMELYSWGKVFSDEKINLTKQYSGVQVFVEFTLVKASLQLGSSIVFFIFYFALKK